MNLKSVKRGIAVAVAGLFLVGAVFGASPPRVDTPAQATAQNWNSC